MENEKPGGERRNDDAQHKRMVLSWIRKKKRRLRRNRKPIIESNTPMPKLCQKTYVTIEGNSMSRISPLFGKCRGRKPRAERNGNGIDILFERGLLGREHVAVSKPVKMMMRIFVARLAAADSQRNLNVFRYRDLFP